MADRPLILISNDDGVDSPGLLALTQALAAVGEVVVYAPEHNWSAAGHTKTMHKPLRVTPTSLADGSPAFTTSGAPADCVALALMGLLPRPAALVVSGINRGANVGHDLTYSGTVAAAMEAVIFGVSAIAVSLDSIDRPDPTVLHDAAAFVARLAQAVLLHGLPPNTLLNVNVPNRPASEIRGIELTRQGQRVYRDVLVERQDPRGRNYYWIGGDAPTGVPEPGTDIGALAAGRISITPIELDLTHYGLLEELYSWHLE
jgi:5'-nucleotidase